MMTTLNRSNNVNEPGATLADRACRMLVLMDHSLDLIELQGRRGVIEGVSSAITDLAGYESRDLIGRHFRDLVHLEDCAAAERAFAEVISSGRAGPVQLRYRTKDGSWRTVLASARNYLADPATRAIVILTRDVTDQLLAERRLDTANEELRRLSHELINSQEAERGHLARELHDDISQMLAGLSLCMVPAPAAAAQGVAAEVVSTWRMQVQEVLAHLRALIENLHPMVLTKLGLAAAIQSHVERLRLISDFDVQLDIRTELGPLNADVALNCFRIVQEALTNTQKHAGAHAAWVTLMRVGKDLHLMIRDDGIGFDVAAAGERAVDAGTVGLLSMRERASLSGGQLDIDSELGRGTCVVADIPCGLSGA